MIKTMPPLKKPLSLDLFPAFVLSAIFLAGAIFWVVFALGERERAEDFFQFSVERLADQLLRSQMMERLSSEEFPPNVLGWGVFAANGQAITRWGNVPNSLSLPPEELRRGFTAWKHRTGDVFDFVKALMPFRMTEREHRRMMDRGFRSPMDEHGPELGWDQRPPRSPFSPRLERPWTAESFVFLRLLQPHFEASQRVWLIKLLAGPLVWGGVLFWVGLLWYKSRRYERDLDKSREVLSFAEAARTLSHEIRNPLSAILLQTALLDRNRDEVRIIEEEVRRISRLVERVRDFLRDARGRPEPQNVWKTLSALTPRFQTPFGLHPSVDPGLNVDFDEVRFRSVLENLLKNAYESGPDPRVEVVITQPKPAWIRIEVLDRGEGLSSETQKRAFTPFYTTKIQGSGIGLAVSRRFTEAAGGRLRLENRSEGGARAVLDLPQSGENS
jgi:signal transduction histidine kinase